MGWGGEVGVGEVVVLMGGGGNVDEDEVEIWCSNGIYC